VRKGGNFVNSQFEEISDTSAILALVAQHVTGVKIGPSGTLEGLSKTAELETVRRLWKLDDPDIMDTSRFGKVDSLNIVVDTMDFGHIVGEVELVLEPSAASDMHTELIQEVDGALERFMKKHAWAFPEGKPVGKLSAYYALKANKDRSGRSTLVKASDAEQQMKKRRVATVMWKYRVLQKTLDMGRKVGPFFNQFTT